MSFAIPIDVAAKVARQLRDSGVVTRGWLGVVVQEVDRALAQQLGMDKPEGALVARVLPDSPAARAGVQAGDVIMQFNGVPLASSTELPHRVGIADPGEVADVAVMRGGKVLPLKVEIGMLRPEVASGSLQTVPADDAQPRSERPAQVGGVLGMSIRRLTVDERRDAQIVGGGGLMINDVTADGPAARAGLRAGDILLQLSGQEVDTPARYAEVVGRLTPGQTVPVLVQRAGAPRFLALDVPRPAVTP